jgi:hypothetical protein
LRVFLYLFRPRRDHLARQYLLTQERRLLDSPRSPTLRVWDLLSRQAGSWSRRAMKVTSAFGQYSLLPMSSASFFFDFDLDSSRLLRFLLRTCVYVCVFLVCRRARRNGVLLSQTPFFFFSFLLCDVHMQRTSLQFFLSCLVCWFSFRIIFFFVAAPCGYLLGLCGTYPRARWNLSI